VKNKVLFLSARFLLISLLALPAVQATAQQTVINGGWLFDGIADERVRNTGLVVAGGVFIEVQADLGNRDFGEAKIIQLSDEETILPGIFDLHAHYNVNLFCRRRRDDVDVIPVIFLANGVTSTFPAGEYDPEDMWALRKTIDRGEKVGPRLFSSGPYFGGARIGWNPDYTTSDINAQVDLWAERGVRGFKAKRITPEHLRALIARAHQHGLTVTGHLGSGYINSVNPRDAIFMGIDRIEHFLGGDAMPADKSAYASLVDFQPGTPEFDSIAALFIKRHVYFDATITAFGYFGQRTEGYQHWTDESRFFTPFVRKEVAKGPGIRTIEMFDKIYWVKRKTIKAFYDAGGGSLITLGTDHPSTGQYIAGFSAHREIEVMVLAGLPPAAALKIATINGAHALNVGDKLGSIEAGKFADLLVVKGNPLQDIRTTHNLRLVMKAGHVYDSAELLNSVAGKLGPADEEAAKDW